MSELTMKALRRDGRLIRFSVFRFKGGEEIRAVNTNHTACVPRLETAYEDENLFVGKGTSDAYKGNVPGKEVYYFILLKGSKVKDEGG